ncbi:MAG: hypothetical protein JSU96_17930 [Acidobacteriota bacterium]|nr:MAG: hypothetical protein JSU96_17930 [Acidobacteriota bacterium]
MSDATEVQNAIEDILKIIIDEWYEKVSGYYITAERIAADPSITQEEELKRFHDSSGHRIKFSKDDLDFTYGLRSYQDGDSILIEVSANNKVENFDIEDFRVRLSEHYTREGLAPVPTPAELKKFSFGEVFQLDSDFGEAFKVELREGKADIMRLAFRLNGETLAKLVARPQASKNLVEMFCVTPFRNIYAIVYRRSG